MAAVQPGGRLVAFIDDTPYAHPKAWGAPNPNPRPRLSLEEWAARRDLLSTRPNVQEDN